MPRRPLLLCCASLLLALTISLDARQASPQALAAELLAVPTPAERTQWLDAHREAISAEVQSALNARASELQTAGRLDDAEKAYTVALEFNGRVGDRRMRGRTLAGAATVPGARGDYEAALSLLREALTIATDEHDDLSAAAVYSNLGNVYRRRGEYGQALEAFQRALPLARGIGSKSTEARALNNLANVYGALGNYREALAQHQASIAIKETLDNPADLAITLANIGGIYSVQGNYERAIDYQKRAIDLMEKAGSRRVAAPWNDLGRVYQWSGRPALALDAFRRALASAEASGERLFMGLAHSNLAELMMSTGQLTTADAEIEQAIAIQREIGDRYNLASTLSRKGELRQRQGQVEAAIEFIEQARRVSGEIGALDLAWGSDTQAGWIYRQAGRLAEAEEAFRAGIRAVEQLRDQAAGGGDSRQRFLGERLGPYQGLVDVLVETHRAPDALVVAEQARGRVLAEALSDTDAAARPLSADERTRLHGLELRIADQTARLSAAERAARGDQAAVSAAREALAEAKRAHAELRDQLDQKYTLRRLARGRVLGDTRGTAAHLLADDQTAIVEFALAEETLHVFVVTRDPDHPQEARVQVVSTAVDRGALDADINAFRDALAARTLGFRPLAQKLHGLLMAPLRVALGTRTRLIIVPDEALWMVPFDALESSGGQAVIDRYTVSYAPSIAVLSAMRERRLALEARHAQPQLLVVADPVSPLPPLPDAARQAHDLKAMYGARSVGLTGAAATESAVRAALPGATVVHFATHGVLDSTSPAYSYLQLTPATGAGAENDGRLEAWELQGLDLQAEVAVLAACDTARGRISAGEGVVGLSWSLLAAGTPATVVTLWEVGASSATALTSALHRTLRAPAGRGVAAARRDAALAIRRDPRFRHPFYWAGFVTVGDSR